MSDIRDIDWNKQPYVTHQQLVEMPGYLRAWFNGQPNIWRNLDHRLDVLHNCAHPDNALLLGLDLIAEAQRARQ